MLRFVNLLAGAVRRFPWATIVVVLVIFGILGAMSSQAVTSEGNEGFAPDAPELDASNQIAEIFGDDSSGTVMQVVVSSDDGDVITAEGLATVERVEEILADSALADDLQETAQGSVISFLAPVQGLGDEQGPSARIVVGTDGGDVFTPEGLATVDAVIEAVSTSSASAKLDTSSDTGAINSWLTPMLAAAAQGPSAQVVITAEGGDVITAEGLAASLALQQAVLQSPLAAKLPQGDPTQPASFGFMAPVELAVQQGQFDPTLPTEAVKAAWTQSFAALPEQASASIPFLLSNDQDLTVPAAAQGMVSFSLTEALTADEEATLRQVVAAVPAADGYELAYLAPAPTDADAFKATYLTRAAFLPVEATEFLPFLSSNDADLAVPTAEKGLVVVGLTEDLTAEESSALADALAAADTPDGFTIGYLPAEPTTDQLKQAYSDNLSFIPAEFAGQVESLLADDADGEAVTASSGLMIVFLDNPSTEAEFEEFSQRQQAFVDELAAAELPEGYSAGAFSIGLIFSAGGDALGEVGRMFGLAAAIIVVVLLFNFWIRVRARGGTWLAIRRTGADTVLTLVTILIAIVWMQGLGVLLGPDYLGVIGYFNQILQILPILIIGLGVDYGIHMTSRYREELAAGNDVSESIRHAIRTVGVALVLATITTMVGFLTNLVSPVPALADFGVLAAVGILSAFLLMLTFVPAVRLILDRRAERAGRLDGTALDVEGAPGFIGPLVAGIAGGVFAYTTSVVLEVAIDGVAFGDSFDAAGLGIFAAIGAVVGVTLLQLPRITGAVSVVAEKFAWGVVIIALALAGIGEYGRQQLETSFSFTDFVPVDNPLLETFDVITEDFGGGFGETTNVLVGGDGEDVATVAVHNAQVDAWENLRDTPDVTQFGGAPAVDVSPIQVIADLGNPQSEIYDAEASAALADLGVGDDLRVAEGTDVVGLYDALVDVAPDAAGAALHATDDGYDAALWTINTSAGDGGASELRTGLNDDFAPVVDAGVTAVPTSENIINTVVVDSLGASQLSSLLITLAAATLILVLNFWIEARRPILGVITMLPVGLVVLLTFGMMALRGIPFGPVTATISALAVGIGVPFTIHITHRFLEDRVRMDSTEEAIRSTTRHTGGALAGSAFTTMAGFGSLVTSNLVPFQQFGEVTFWAILFALLGSLLLLPSMLVIWDRYHRRRGDSLLDEAAVHEALDS